MFFSVHGEKYVDEVVCVTITHMSLSLYNKITGVLTYLTIYAIILV